MFRTRLLDLPGDLHVGGVQVDIEIHRGHPGADGGGPAGGVDGMGAIVGHPHGVLHLLRQPLELPLADVGQLPAVGGGGRLVVQVEGLAEALGCLAGHVVGQLVTVPDGAVAHRDEGDHIRAADAGVLPLMAVHVDQLHGAADGLYHGLAQGLGLTHHGDHAAVVVGVGGVVQQLDPGLGPEAVHDLFHRFHIPPLAEVGDGLDQFFGIHGGAAPFPPRSLPEGARSVCLHYIESPAPFATETADFLSHMRETPRRCCLMLKITMFQTPAIELDGQPVALPFKRAEALLYYMVVRRSATRQELIALLWESCDEATGLKNLRNALYTLKKSLGGDFLLSPQKSLVTVNGQWELDSDYDRFVRQGDFSAYCGPFLQGFGVKHALSFEEWLVRTREKLHEQYLGRLSDLAEAAKARGDLEEAVRQAQEYLREDPYDEETAVFLMTCYQDMRKYNKAAQVYQRLKEQLSEELGAAPMEDTTMLYYRIMNQWNDSTQGDEETADVPIGREDAYARLRAAVNSFAAGETRRCSQLLIGEGGSGKSELVSYFLRANDKAELLTIHCDCLPVRDSNPLALWDRIMVELWQFIENEQIVLPMYLRAQLGQSFSIFREEGAAPAPLSEKALRRYDQSLEDAVLLLFSVVTRRRRTLLVIEDLQWMGADSLRLTDAVLRRLEGGGLMAVLTCRDHAPESTLRCLDELEADGLLRRQRLHPLTLNETQLMLSRQLGEETAQKLSAQFYRETGGNLYLLSELTRSYRRGGDVEAILRSMSDVLMERLSGLSDGAVRVAELVCLFDRRDQYRDPAGTDGPGRPPAGRGAGRPAAPGHPGGAPGGA